MAIIEILLPKMGESVAEATITKFVVNPGERTEADEPLVEIATDKVDSEVPAPEDGMLVEWLVGEGDVVAVGQAIARFELDGDEGAETIPAAPVAAAPAPAPVPTVAPPQPQVIEALEAPLDSKAAPLDALPGRVGANGRFYSPLVRSIAQSEGVSAVELDGIQGTGSEGRVTKRDILGYLQTRGQAAPSPVEASAASAPARTTPQAAVPAPTISVSGQDEVVEMDRMRKMIADHMVRSVQTSPHVTSFVEADMTRIVEWRNRNKKAFEQAHGTKLTFTPLIAEAIIKAIKDFPESMPVLMETGSSSRNKSIWAWPRLCPQAT
jgi:2-oxoglutarate dehydrogenase E2 component (dihydrolipoamide succinyltransferase)